MRLLIKPTRGSGYTGRCKTRAGFTFAEVLAALVIMAIVIPTSIQGLRIASRAGVVAYRKGVAVQLADSLLNELVVTEMWQSTGQGGVFEDQREDYRWRAWNESWGVGTMRQVSIEVSYEVQNLEYYVRLSTLAQPPTE